MVNVRQGDIFWVEMGKGRGSEPSYRRPQVVVQNNLYNRSRLQTVVICGLTTNLARALSPGNVVLKKGEGGLPRDSVVNVTQLATIDRSRLGECLGSLSQRRVREIIEGLKLLLEPRDL